MTDATPAAQLTQAADKPEDFGHEPVWINDGYCGGCERCGDIEEREVCVRCFRLIPTDSGPWPRDSVNWPCATAVVLGITAREVAR